MAILFFGCGVSQDKTQSPVYRTLSYSLYSDDSVTTHYSKLSAIKGMRRHLMYCLCLFKGVRAVMNRSLAAYYCNREVIKKCTRLKISMRMHL
jgi:hypothetical protein